MVHDSSEAEGPSAENGDPPKSPQRNTRPTPALTRKKRGELPRIVPQDGPRNRVAVSPADAVRNSIDDANVAEFLKALHALAQLEPGPRYERYNAIRRALQNNPPQKSSVERLNALMVGLDKALSERREFTPIKIGWRMLQAMLPSLAVVPGPAEKADLKTAREVLAGLSGTGNQSVQTN